MAQAAGGNRQITDAADEQRRNVGEQQSIM